MTTECKRVLLFSEPSTVFFDTLQLPEEKKWCDLRDVGEFEYGFVPTSEASGSQYPVVNFLLTRADTVMNMSPPLRRLERAEVTPEFVTEKFKATMTKWRNGNFELEWDLLFDLEHFSEYFYPCLNLNEVAALFFKTARNGAFLLRQSSVTSQVSSPDAQVFTLNYVTQGYISNFRLLFVRGVGVYLLVGKLTNLDPVPLRSEVEQELTACNYLKSIQYQPPPFRSVLHALFVIGTDIGLDLSAMLRNREPVLE